ncbi:AAA family ATPase [Candidatus Symbiothrix dinenymphae]|uniref:AAA family ATPase n=1 Tax=Candidatus Symbiothrix dinenymphae TaxID=467085 RepID=UPI0006C1255A|nr:AAA family ATPase [Candidatus Symbiothrix dinenymphae]GAP71238.1 AAA ATPase [Candidatus Symbiothrix dinenymphae]
MEAKKFKRLPYGSSNYKSIRTENYAYVDKTMYIEMLENETNKNLFFIRPRKFGKSLFFMTLSCYYDMNEAENFEQLFGDLYIGKHPTPEKNSYAVLRFDFSGMDTSSEESFRVSFNDAVQTSVRNFFNVYPSVFSQAAVYSRELSENKLGILSLDRAFSAAEQSNVKIYFIIDEYDHFANDLIAMGNRLGKDFYKTMVSANGLVRDFYERIKNSTKFVSSRTFITGISPVMLDDLTSGYNISTNLTLHEKYNEMMGFTKKEVDWLMHETGVNPDFITVDMEAYYDGYLFNKDGANRVYNPAMVLYFFNQIIDLHRVPDSIIDENLKTDYGRLKKLTQNDSNRATVIQIIKEDGIIAEVLNKFSVDTLNDTDYFISLLFYMGLLTIKEPVMGKVWLGIPNYSIRTLYWEYVMKFVREQSPAMTIETRHLDESITALAMEGDLKRFIAYVSEHALSKLSDHDLQHFDEKYIKILLLAYLLMSRIYVPMSEYEAVPGRTDIYLQRSPQLPEIKYEWVFELKYCKAKAKSSEITKLQKEGEAQIKQYLGSHRLSSRPDLKAAVIVFIGKNKYRIFEHSI